MEKNTNYTDQGIFKRIASGDGTAFEEFFNIYSGKLASYVAGLLHSDQWAQEIVQDVFEKLWRIRETIGDIEYPAAYVYRMTANRVKDHLRHHSHEIKLQYYVTQHLQEGSNNTQEQVDYRFSAQLLAEAVAQLPPQRSLIFKLRHEQGLGYDIIAEQLKLSRNTVRNQLNLAIQQIRLYLKNAGYIIIFICIKIIF